MIILILTKFDCLARLLLNKRKRKVLERWKGFTLHETEVEKMLCQGYFKRCQFLHKSFITEAQLGSVSFVI